MEEFVTKQKEVTSTFVYILVEFLHFFSPTPPWSVIHFCLNRVADSSFQVYLERQGAPFIVCIRVVLLDFSLNLILLHELLGMKD